MVAFVARSAVKSMKNIFQIPTRPFWRVVLHLSDRDIPNVTRHRYLKFFGGVYLFERKEWVEFFSFGNKQYAKQNIFYFSAKGFDFQILLFYLGNVKMQTSRCKVAQQTKFFHEFFKQKYEPARIFRKFFYSKPPEGINLEYRVRLWQLILNPGNVNRFEKQRRRT